LLPYARLERSIFNVDVDSITVAVEAARGGLKAEMATDPFSD